MANPFASDTLNPADFDIYKSVDSGVVILKKDKRATISFVNDVFAAYLGTTPHLLINRGLDSIAINKRPHYTNTVEFSKNGTTVGRKMRGGRSVDAIIQQGEKKGKPIALTIYHMENHKDYFLGYVRPSTRLEQVIEAATLNPVVDRAWKPIARFFLSGKFRPFVTSLASILIPYLLAQQPELLSIIRSLFPEI